MRHHRTPCIAAGIPLGSATGRLKYAGVLKPQDSAANLQYRTMQQRSIRVHSPAGYRDTVDQRFTADTGTDQQAGAVLPGKIKML